MDEKEGIVLFFLISPFFLLPILVGGLLILNKFVEEIQIWRNKRNNKN